VEIPKPSEADKDFFRSLLPDDPGKPAIRKPRKG